MYEHRRARPVPRPVFLRRLAGHAALALVLLASSLAIGMWGYVRFEGLAWIDAFLNASMLLGGMGPVDPPRTAGGKLFAGAYALYAGLVFLAAAGLVAAPLLHRLMHRFHFDQDER
ncbi:MAG: hypothetical protein ABW221_19605 [Vicinamibacteria bacterium]